jgi:hypothetical protein
MQNPASELRRIPLPRTTVNKRKKEGRGCYYSPAHKPGSKSVREVGAIEDTVMATTIIAATRLLHMPYHHPHTASSY